MPDRKRGRGWLWWCGGETPRDRRNLVRVMWSMAAWAVSFVCGAQLIRRKLVAPGWPSWSLATVPLVLAAFGLLAYARFLREADELSRLIHLRALAIGFGGGWIAVAGYRVLELAGAPNLDGSDVALVMWVLFTAALVVGRIRYS